MPDQPVSGSKRFVLDWLGPAIVLFFLINALFIGNLTSPMFTSPQNSMNLLMQAAPTIAIALATALMCMQNGGVDLSLGGAVALASMMIGKAALDGDAGGGVASAIIVCVLFGALSGFLIVCLKAPSFLVTLLVGGVLRSIALIASNGYPAQDLGLAFFGADKPLSAYLLIVLAGGVAVGLCFLVKYLTRIARPFGIFSYVGAAIIAVLTGYYITARLGAAVPSVGTGYEYTIILVWGALSTSRLLGRTPLAIALALVPAYYFAVIQNVLALMGVDAFFQQILSAFLALIFLTLAYVFHYLRKRWLGEQPPLLS